MSTAMPVLETERLRVRPYELADLEAAHQLLDHEAWQTGQTLAERERWLRWCVLNYEALANLYQPPYGDRAIVLRASGELVGSVGLVPSYGPLGRLPSFGAREPASVRHEPAMGLFWATRAAHRRRGYAAEAARALIQFMFTQWNLHVIVAMTEHENVASQAVMHKLGMSVERNPLPEPPWFQVVGVLKAETYQGT